MLNQMRVWIADKKIRLNNNIDCPINITEKKTPTDNVQEHKKVFGNMQLCSLAPHAVDCDIFNCHKSPCATWQPDRIVSKEYSVKACKSKPLIRH